MKFPISVILLFVLTISCQTKKDRIFPPMVFETSNGDSCATYSQTITFWKEAAKNFEEISIHELGQTDAGKPLHLVIVNQGEHLEPSDLANTNKTVLFINNGIHPGEPDGIEACKLLTKRLVDGGKSWKNVVLAIVPVYNVGGMLQRNNYTRANQNGPAEYGFRGNAQNLDLNRDCIKMDSKNALAFANIFNTIDPDLFFDTHVSNGANYQHVVTLLTTQEQKLGGPLESFYKTELTPHLYAQMESAKYPMVPYVNVWGRSPDNGGIDQLMDSPRYTNGYSTLHHTPSYTIETHMLKSFATRVDGTLKLLEIAVAFLNENGAKLQSIREAQKQHYAHLNEFPIYWQPIDSLCDSVNYLGYQMNYQPSLVTGQDRMFYDTLKPFKTTIPYRCYFEPKTIVSKPKFYALRGGYFEVVKRLKANRIQMTTLDKDTTVDASVYYLDEVSHAPNVYEKHHVNTAREVSILQKKITLRAGDIIIPTGTSKDRLIVETLEPQAIDSYFVWNFFDAVLQQKEGFSPYVWEDIAWEHLQNNPSMKSAFEAAKATDPILAVDPMAQLNWIYKASNTLEENYKLYPVFRLD